MNGIDKVMGDRNSFLYFGLAIFASESKYDAVSEVVYLGDTLCFELVSGKRGFLERNTAGDWDVWVGASLVSVMESDIYDLLMDKNRDIHRDYKNLDGMIKNVKSVRGAVLLRSMKQAIERIFAQSESEVLASGMTGSTVIGDEEYIYAKGMRIVHNLN